MKFAVRTANITPSDRLFLAGSTARVTPYESVRDPIWVRTVVLQANKPIVILSFDLLGGDRNFVNSLKRALQFRFGYQEDEILIHFTHTHNSFYASGNDSNLQWRRGYYSVGKGHSKDRRHEFDYAPDEAYYRFLEHRVIESISHCTANLTEGVLDVAKGRSNVGISRRRMTESGVRFAPNPEADIDRDLHVLRLSDLQGNCRAVLFSYACHPTTLSDKNYISADYVGRACRMIEQRYPGAAALFLQGCCGDIRPAGSVEDDQFKVCSYEDMERIGDQLANDVHEIVRQGDFRRIDCHFRTSLSDVKLYTDRIALSELADKLMHPNANPYVKWTGRRLLQAMDEGTAETFMPLYIAILYLDDRTPIIALESEIPSGYSLMIKRKLLPQLDPIVLGYSNGMFTYVPTRTILAEGGYEAVAYMYHCFRGPFVPETEDIILGRIANSLF